MIFRNRREAGRLLAGQLAHYANRADVLVLALPRGGVPVGLEVAESLRAPMDVFVVRKVGVPGCEELAMGAISTGGVCVRNEEVIEELGIRGEVFEAGAERERVELERRERAFRGQRPAPDVRGRTVILVDDGLATGSTMRAAARALRSQQPARIIVGVPVGAPEACEEFRREVDEVVCAVTPEPFHGVGQWYEDFTQTSDDEVHDILGRFRAKSLYAAGSL
ncbi:MAG TPA: phosphoribosyltransferase [Pyrinomonadaceae bacterium]|nr:phosphoribosyltransferase [Pyrinomonadaceae bacterium]